MSIALHMTFQPYGASATAQTITIEVISASFNAEQILNIGSTTSGAGAGKVTFNPFVFTKTPDVHSPVFWSYMCSGTAFQKVTLAATTAGANVPLFTFTMGLVAFKTIAVSASESDGHAVETITVEYGQMAYSVTSQNPDGSLGKAVAAGWDRVRNVQEDPLKVGS